MDRLRRPVTFTARGVDGACNQIPVGISQMSLYVDGVRPVTYINNPFGTPGTSRWTPRP